MWLTVSKIHRAFREFDRFSDEQCEAYIRRARTRHWVSMLLCGLGAVPIVLAVTGGGWIGGAAAAHALGIGDRVTTRQGELLDAAAGVLIIVVPPLAGCICGLLVRDWWLRWAIRQQLGRTTCPKCEYQLLGLRVAGERVVCPECGMALTMESLGITPGDLAMPDSRVGELAARA